MEVIFGGESCEECSNHTSYLSRAARAVPVEKKLSCGEICPQDRLTGGEIFHMTDCQVKKLTICYVEKVLHMRNVKKICNVEK